MSTTHRVLCPHNPVYRMLGKNVSPGSTALYADFPELKFSGDIPESKGRFKVYDNGIGVTVAQILMRCEVDNAGPS